MLCFTFCTLFYPALENAKISSFRKKCQLMSTNTLTLYQTSPAFYMSVVKVLKTLWEKEKLLVVTVFSMFLPLS